MRSGSYRSQLRWHAQELMLSVKEKTSQTNDLDKVIKILMREIQRIYDQLKRYDHFPKESKVDPDVFYDVPEYPKVVFQDMIFLLVKEKFYLSCQLPDMNLENKEIQASLVDRTEALQDEINTNFSCELLKELAITTLSTLFISGVGSSVGMISINILPILIAGILFAGPSAVDAFPSHWVAPSTKKRLKQLLKIVPVGWFAWTVSTGGVKAIGQFLGVVGLSKISRSQFAESAIRKVIGDGIEKDVADVIFRSIATIAGFHIGDLMVSATQKPPFQSVETSSISPHSLFKSETLSSFVAPVVENKLKNHTLSPTLSSNLHISEEDIQPIFQSLIETLQSDREALKSALKKVGIVYQYLLEEDNVDAILKKLGSHTEVASGRWSTVYFSPKYKGYILKKTGVESQIQENVGIVLGCQNIVGKRLNKAPIIHHVIESKTEYLMIMDEISALTINEWASMGGLSLKDRLLVGLNVLKSVHEMHKLGIIHKDLHKDNVLVEKATGDIYFIDFDQARYTKVNYPSMRENRAVKKYVELLDYSQLVLEILVGTTVKLYVHSSDKEKITEILFEKFSGIIRRSPSIKEPIKALSDIVSSLLDLSTSQTIKETESAHETRLIEQLEHLLAKEIERIERVGSHERCEGAGVLQRVHKLVQNQTSVAFSRLVSEDAFEKINSESGALTLIRKSRLFRDYITPHLPNQVIHVQKRNPYIDVNQLALSIECQNKVSKELGCATEIYQAIVSEKTIVTIAEQMTGMSLSDWIQQPSLSLRDRINVSANLISTLQSIRQLGILHGRLSTDAFWVEKERLTVNVGAFDHAKYFEEFLQEKKESLEAYSNVMSDSNQMANILIEILNRWSHKHLSYPINSAPDPSILYEHLTEDYLPIVEGSIELKERMMFYATTISKLWVAQEDLAIWEEMNQSVTALLDAVEVLLIE